MYLVFAMKKLKYYYNTQTLRYEKLVTPVRIRLLRFFGFLSAMVVSSILVIYLYDRFFPKPKNLEADRKYEVLQENYRLIRGRVKTLEQQLAALEQAYQAQKD